MIQQYYYWEKLDTGPSWVLKGESTKVWRSVTHEESEFFFVSRSSQDGKNLPLQHHTTLIWWQLYFALSLFALEKNRKVKHNISGEKR